jgi:hypothetical protein
MNSNQDSATRMLGFGIISLDNGNWLGRMGWDEWAGTTDRDQ